MTTTERKDPLCRVCNKRPQTYRSGTRPDGRDANGKMVYVEERLYWGYCSDDTCTKRGQEQNALAHMKYQHEKRSQEIWAEKVRRHYLGLPDEESGNEE